MNFCPDLLVLVSVQRTLFGKEHMDGHDAVEIKHVNVVFQCNLEVVQWIHSLNYTGSVQWDLEPIIPHEYGNFEPHKEKGKKKKINIK